MVSNRHSPYRQTGALAGAARHSLRTIAAALLIGPLLPRRPQLHVLEARSTPVYVCSCKAITASEVKNLAATGMRRDALVQALGLDEPGCCGRCLRDLDRLVLIAEDSIREPAVALAR
jgi:bacterioferritin-associated ferredoxin